MNYKIKEGITKIKICDTDLIVAKRSLWESCVGIRPIPKKYSICWALMENGKTSDDVIRILADLLKKPLGEMQKKLSPIFTNLANDGYLEVTEEEEQ